MGEPIDVDALVARARRDERAKLLRALLDEYAEHPGAPGWVASWAKEMSATGAVEQNLEKYYKWALAGDSGTSSMTMVEAITGACLLKSCPSVPRDGDDFGRCYRVLRTFPELREKLHVVAEKRPEWAGLVEHWGELETLYEEELPSGTAPRLYRRIKELTGAA